MTTKTNAIRINAKYILITLAAVVLSWVLHELAHWATGTFLGYQMAMTLNTAYAVDASGTSNAHAQIISAAGPLLTLLEALLVFGIMHNRPAQALYAFLFTCFYTRLLATGISFLNLNDEARISKALGVGTFTLPLIMTAILFVLLFRTSASYGFSKRFNLATLGLIILFSSILILSDQYFKIRLL
ncbi:hypothetical protein [Flavisolibacter tropicus]|uniref:Peptidase M50 domain-containing protein n=1 Tax=Flavisolibacter tropicus TaxID=1492898 RepID=A0A172TW17_9BACT|nr:hypothetical protein [Flavisolibacter tropicus]ANE51301.1 hypothetical protein SY85_13050 [Flavisolibacter tropicus]